MAKIGVRLKINTSKIDMARLFAGKQGNYLDATVFIDLAELDQYDNSGMITQDVSKEEKDQGVKGNILGNCQVFWVEGGQAPQKAGAPIQQVPQQNFQQVAPMQQQPQQGQPMGVSQAPLAQQAANHPQAQQAPIQQQPAPQQGVPFDDDIPFNQPR